MKNIGVNIKRLRKEKKLSLKELAERIGATPSFISQVENNKISPSLSKLKDISDSLNTTISLLIGEDIHTGLPIIVKQEDRRYVDNIGTGVNIYLLSTPDANKQMEPLLIKLQKGATSGDKRYQHFGQEFVLVLKGKIEISLNNTKYILNAGDSLYFNSNTPHSFKNICNSESEVIWVDTPPSF